MVYSSTGRGDGLLLRPELITLAPGEVMIIRFDKRRTRKRRLD